jgi:L-lactate dehydrogenase complex protein LldG
MTRDLFPSALRARLKPAGPLVPHPGAFATAPMPATTDAAVAQFTEACEAVGGRVSRVTTAAAAADIVLGYLEAPEWQAADQTGPAPFVCWEAAHLALPEVPSLVRSRGAECLDAFVHADQATRDVDYRRLDTAVVGVTGSHAALADTGSVVLVHGAGRARLVSLLPPVHVALVAIDQLRATLGALVAAEPALLHASTNVVVVTGPSRTADIEMTLTRGVHGPRIVHVVFVG